MANDGLHNPLKKAGCFLGGWHSPEKNSHHFSKWLVSPIYKPWKGHLAGEEPQIGDLLTMVINHLQVLDDPPSMY